jgi:hypothetical protein
MTIPNKWKILTAQQAYKAVFFSLEGQTTSAKMRILETILPENLIPVYAKLSAKKIRSLLKDVEWVYSTPILEPHEKFFYLNDKKFVLPDAKFKNVNLIEFSYATEAYNDMVENKNHKALNKIVACLCRPEVANLDILSPQYSGDSRERFNPELLDFYTDQIQHLPIEFKSYFIHYFNSCADNLVAQFKPLFTQQNETADDRNKANTPNFGWLGVIMSLADAGVFGNFEQTQYTNIYTALAYRLKKYYDEKDLK